jgi:hypothetical protein
MTTALWILLGIGVLIALTIIGFTIITVTVIKRLSPKKLEEFFESPKTEIYMDGSTIKESEVIKEFMKNAAKK